MLDKPKELSYGLLYSQSTEELKAVKQYLVENLDKGFIVPSQAPFSSPVLFVKKPSSSLSGVTPVQESGSSPATLIPPHGP